jgi:tetratricopeptide (TPR) repeat protein
MRTKVFVGIVVMLGSSAIGSRSLGQFPPDGEFLRGYSSPHGKEQQTLSSAVRIYNRARDYYSAGEYDKAMAAYNEALRHNPNLIEAYDGRGRIHDQMAERRRAIAEYSEAVRRNPKYAPAYRNRAGDYYELGLLERAIADYSESLRLDPQGENGLYAHFGRALVYVHAKDHPKAIADFKKVVQYTAKDGEDHASRGKAYFLLGNYDAAASEYDKAERVAPKNAYVLNHVAWFKATCPKDSLRDGTEALRSAQNACELTKWKNGGYIDTLAAAYFEKGEFENALRYQRQALSTPDVPGYTRKELKQHLALYENHRPLRDKPLVTQ